MLYEVITSLGKRKGAGPPVGQTPARAVGVTDQHSQVQLYQDGPADKVRNNFV